MGGSGSKGSRSPTHTKLGRNQRDNAGAGTDGFRSLELDGADY